ncbi:helix-turn-helix domain-containing protein [Candidatus Parcubacteria bacterium]|nr:MAG: helix-turn-helix domain-containing protein [Candidatus Parcubacteria bacterium]
MNREYSDFQSLFNEKLRERGLTVKRLSELSNIATEHLENLSTGNFERMPPAPYIRGYLARLAPILGFDADSWWEELAREHTLRGSGASDELPKNRFARQSRAKFLIGGAVVILAAAYVALRFAYIFGEPEILITDPAQNPAYTRSAETVIRGNLSNADVLSVNGESVEVREGGGWEKAVTLQSGPNSFEIEAKKFLGREKRLTRQIFYEPIPQTTTTPLAPAN